MMLSPTIRERNAIRVGLEHGYGEIVLKENDDGTWFVDVFDIVIEGESAAAALRALAAILEES